MYRGFYNMIKRDKDGNEGGSSSSNDDAGDGNDPKDDPSSGESELTIVEMQAENEKLKKENSFLTKESVKRKKALRDRDDQDRKTSDDSLVDQKKFQELAESREKENIALKDSIELRAKQNDARFELDKAGLIDPDLAILLDQSSTIYDPETGKVHGMKEAVAQWKADKPSFFGKKTTPKTQTVKDSPTFTDKGSADLDTIAAMAPDEMNAYFDKVEEGNKK